jgi:signal transduction histidine kinase
MAEASRNQSEELVVFLPIGRDCRLVCDALKNAGIEARACANMTDFLAAVRSGAGGGILGEEALTKESYASLASWIKQQPPWSDFPLIVLTSGGESAPNALSTHQRTKALGNVSLLERPVRSVTLVTAAETALRGRRRQYEAEAFIADRIDAERELTSQAEELARSNADLQRFAYATSHDLQEPLRSMTVFAQLLNRRYKGKLDSEADEFLEYIVSGAQRMGALIDGLLEYSRTVHVESAPFTPVDTAAALHWARMNLRLVLEESHAELTHGDLPTISGDHVQIVQLFQNLISNAIKYRRPDTPPRIRVSAEQENGNWVFSVSDNGVGVPKEYTDRVFDLFRRLHGSKIPGTGIGLAICKRIVEKHGGRIWVETGSTGGTTFCFTIPSLPASEAVPASEAADLGMGA